MANKVGIGDRVYLPGKSGYTGTLEEIADGFARVRRDDGTIYHCAVGILVKSD